MRKIKEKPLTKIQKALIKVGYAVKYTNGIPKIITHGEFNSEFNKKF